MYMLFSSPSSTLSHVIDAICQILFRDKNTGRLKGKLSLVDLVRAWEHVSLSYISCRSVSIYLTNPQIHFRLEVNAEVIPNHIIDSDVLKVQISIHLYWHWKNASVQLIVIASTFLIVRVSSRWYWRIASCQSQQERQWLPLCPLGRTLQIIL